MAREPEKIEDDIASIRARMEGRLDSLGNQLDPVRLFGEVTGTDRTEGMDTVGAIVETARRNPLSAALVGAGMLGLFYSNRYGSKAQAVSADPYRPAPADSADPAQRIVTRMDRLEAEMRSTRDNASTTAAVTKARVKGKVYAAREAVSETLDDLGDTVSETYESAKDRASSFISGGRETATRSASAARHAPRRAKAQGAAMADWVTDNPVPAGLMALAAGAAVSSFLTARNSTSRAGAAHELYEATDAHADKLGNPSAPPPSAPAKRTKAKTTVAPKPVKRTTTKSVATKAATVKTAAAKTAAPKKPAGTKAKLPAKAKATGPAKSISGSNELTRATAVLGRDSAASSATRNN